MTKVDAIMSLREQANTASESLLNLHQNGAISSGEDGRIRLG